MAPEGRETDTQVFMDGWRDGPRNGGVAHDARAGMPASRGDLGAASQETEAQRGRVRERGVLSLWSSIDRRVGSRGVAAWAEAAFPRRSLQPIGGRRVVSGYAARATFRTMVQPANYEGLLARHVAENGVLA